ncbi:MAG TPA: alpha/beta hydrolase [Bryobacteraceae bacterium]|jgi:pimeloyl-ACP methyl ester carboxylesterase|nr:alpha/beta hydrolase [Bryobacteraceae bacterium]
MQTLNGIDPAGASGQAIQPKISYRNQKVGDINIFYREAGSPSRPAVVLLHGFPSSSHMYRGLIPKLAERYRVIAADMPGFGYSDQPAAGKFAYTFAHLTDVMDEFLSAIGVQKYSIYVMDYGSPVGFRLFVKHPERIQAIISQNGNAYVEGLSPFWAEFLEPYWKERNAKTEKKVRGLLALETTRFQYTQGARDPESINPDSYTFDQMILDRPGNPEIQLALFYDYRTNVQQYPQWHETLRRAQPPLLAVWGKNDPIFSPPGAEAFRRDIPKAEIRFLDTGHFALEEDLDEIADRVLAFLDKNVR